AAVHPRSPAAAARSADRPWLSCYRYVDIRSAEVVGEQHRQVVRLRVAHAVEQRPVLPLEIDQRLVGRRGRIQADAANGSDEHSVRPRGYVLLDLAIEEGEGAAQRGGAPLRVLHEPAWVEVLVRAGAGAVIGDVAGDRAQDVH